MECPGCKYQMVRRGFRSTNLGKKQMYLCMKCKKKMTPEWPRMRFSREDVMYAVYLYSKGLSSSKIKERLSKRDVSVSRWTITKWCRKFAH